jgi:hypothetical protein
VSLRIWQGSGSTFSLPWGGQPWVLELDHERPGLHRRDVAGGSFLSLAGLAAPGRSDLNALSGNSLVGVEVVRDRVEATYAPPDWAGLRVRASWSPVSSADGIDLEIQVSASSVGQLKALEVFVSTEPAEAGNGQTRSLPVWVDPRDRKSASLSYDGREPLEMLRQLTTLPLPASDVAAGRPAAFALPSPVFRRSYLEMVHPHDVARRMIVGTDPPGTSARSAMATRYGLLGHDLEKGVIVRGRLRGLWVPEEAVDEASRIAYRDFLSLPPPLGT